MSDQIRTMFSEISEHYDAGNDVLSLGTHRLWKRVLVARTKAPLGSAVLDVATGTGDIATMLADSVGRTGRVVGVDFCGDMIVQARMRHNNQKPQLRFETGDAMNLRFADNSFDRCTISFGIRNVDDPVRALAEMRRVVKPGGRVLVLEFGQPEGPFGAVYRAYSNYLLPVIGGVVSGSRQAYDYLNRTAGTFPCGHLFVEMMRQAGFRDVVTEKLFGGVAYLYIGGVR